MFMRSCHAAMSPVKLFNSSALAQALDTTALTREITMRCQQADAGLDTGPAFIEASRRRAPLWLALFCSATKAASSEPIS